MQRARLGLGPSKAASPQSQALVSPSKAIARLPAASVNAKHVGIYHVASKTYNRRRCLTTMLALDPDLLVIYIRKSGASFEVAKRSARMRAHGEHGFHFYAAWKLETVTP